MKITLLIIAGFLLIAGGGFVFLMTTISEDVERQYSQASKEPLVDFAHLFAALLEQDIEEGELDISRFREGFASAYDREFLARIFELEKRSIHTQVYITDRNGIVIFDSDDGKRGGGGEIPQIKTTSISPPGGSMVRGPRDPTRQICGRRCSSWLLR